MKEKIIKTDKITSFSFTVRNDIACMELARPPKNEIDSLFLSELEAFCENFPEPDLKGMILYGRGRHFSSGANLEELGGIFRNKNREDVTWFLDRNVKSFSALENLPFPVVAAINGCCLGVGLELALVCDFRIAAPRAVFSLPEASFGILPGCGGCIRLPEIVGPARAVEIILTSRSILTEEAKELGLVDYITGRENLLKSAENLIISLSGS